VSNDAKLGLAVGMSVVITVAVIFFRKDTMSAQLPQGNHPAGAAITATPPTAESNAPLKLLPRTMSRLND
jgi:hypothetical protein